MRKITLLFACFFLYGHIYPQKNVVSSSCPGVWINGVCWAKYNVDEPGRFANPGKPYGMLYQWNRKKGWPVSGEVSGWDSSLEPGNTWEAANDPCPAGWRMPTAEEIKTLADRTKVTYTEYTGQDKILGSRYTDIATGNTLFLPIANYRNAQGIENNVVWVYYWSGTDYWRLDHNRALRHPYADAYSVRCVADENACDIVLTASEEVCKEDFPYTWRGTTFPAGTKTGEYRIRRTDPASGCDSIFYLYLTVDTLCGKPCKERGVQINGVCWAESNVDSPNVFADTPESFGALYQWNRKKELPLQGDITQDDWMTYNSYVRWEAANNPCPADWRIPTIGEIYALLDEERVTHEWTQQNGVDGMRFTDKDNGNAVFLPLAGTRSGPSNSDVDEKMGFYWSTTIYEETSAWCVFFGNDWVRTFRFSYGARSVRCVAGRDTTEGCVTTFTDTTVTICTTGLPYSWGDTTFDVGTQPGIYFHRFQRTGTVTGCDSVYRLVLNVHPAFDLYFTGDVCYGEPYNGYGFSLPAVYADTTVSDTLKTVWGCDSVRTLHLTVHPGYDTPLRDTICEGDGYDGYGFQFLEGTSGGTYMQTRTLQTIYGCDSTVTLHLTVLPKYLFAESRDICRGEFAEFQGRRYYESGTYYDSLKTVAGCDSIYRLVLTVHPVFDLYFTGDVCYGESYNGYGFSLPAVYADTTVSDTLKTVWGCDSVRTLHLTVHSGYDTPLWDTICEGDGYNGYGFHFPEGTSGGTYTQIRTLQTVYGCDSTVTLHLTVLPKYFFTESRDICRGEFAEFQGRRYYESGTYDDSLKTVAGCDSIYRLVLTVHPAFDLYFTGDVCYGESYNGYGFSLPAVYADTTVSDTLKTVWGCDSVRTLHLTVHFEYDTPLRDTVCRGDDYRNHGFSLSGVQTGGEHSLTLSSRFGCDSVLHLQLAVQPSYSLTLYDSICPSGRYDKNGFRLSDVTASDTHVLRLKTLAGCDSIVTLNLHVYRDYLFTETENACEGDTVDFRGRLLYESGTYDDALTTVAGCDSIYRLVLDVHPVYAVPLKDVFCEGIPYTRYGFHVAEPGIHILRLKTIHGCDSTVTLTLSEEKKVRGGIGLSLEDCETHGYAFFFEPDSAKGDWQWDMGDGTTYRTQEGYHAYADSGTYRVTLQLETLNGCRNEYVREQWVPHYAREVAIRANRTVIDAETPAVQFKAEAPAGTVCRWEFGDGDTAEGAETEHVYDAATARYYDVVLRVFNADSCVTEDAARIEVLPLPKEVNTFSPNGDGINDVFMSDFRVEIFNRNGLRIYAGEHGWDGTCRTGNATEDTYFYKLYYRTATGDRVKTGFVVLVR